MAKIALSIFLILFGVHLVTSMVSPWVIAASAVIAGLLFGFSQKRGVKEGSKQAKPD